MALVEQQRQRVLRRRRHERRRHGRGVRHVGRHVRLEQVAGQVLADDDIQTEPLEAVADLLHVQARGRLRHGHGDGADTGPHARLEAARAVDSIDVRRQLRLAPHVLGDGVVRRRRVLLDRVIAEVRELVPERRVREREPLLSKPRIRLGKAPEHKLRLDSRQEDPLAHVEFPGEGREGALDVLLHDDTPPPRHCRRQQFLDRRRADDALAATAARRLEHPDARGAVDHCSLRPCVESPQRRRGRHRVAAPRAGRERRRRVARREPRRDFIKITPGAGIHERPPQAGVAGARAACAQRRRCRDARGIAQESPGVRRQPEVVAARVKLGGRVRQRGRERCLVAQPLRVAKMVHVAVGVGGLEVRLLQVPPREVSATNHARPAPRLKARDHIAKLVVRHKGLLR